MDVYDNIGDASYPGGNPVNVAVYVKRLGGDASYVGAVGTDESGARMMEAVKSKGVDISHMQILEGKTAVSHVKLMGGERVFGDYEEGVLKEFRLRPQDITFLCGHDLLVTGIWGMIEKDLPQIAGKIPVAFDFANKFAHENVDIAIPYVTYAFFSYDVESKADFKLRYNKLGCQPRDLEEEQLKEFMRAMQKKGPQAIIVTLGEGGSIAWDGRNFYTCGIVPCKVVDTMGAGDSFIAGFLYGILKGLTMPEAMKAGAQNSAVTLGYFGAW